MAPECARHRPHLNSCDHGSSTRVAGLEAIIARRPAADAELQDLRRHLDVQFKRIAQIQGTSWFRASQERQSLVLPPARASPRGEQVPVPSTEISAGVTAAYGQKPQPKPETSRFC